MIFINIIHEARFNLSETGLQLTGNVGMKMVVMEAIAYPGRM